MCMYYINELNQSNCPYIQPCHGEKLHFKCVTPIIVLVYVLLNLNIKSKLS